jgi:hypothetical protein
VEFTWYGLPKLLKPLPVGTSGVGVPGAVALVSYDKSQFTGCECRETLIFSANKNVPPHLGSYINDELKMMFSFK